MTLLLLGASAVAGAGAELAPINVSDPEWSSWAESLAPKKDITGDFEESRVYAFRKDPVTLRGTTRISPQHGLSLEYREPEARIVVVDRDGVVLRENGRDKPAPKDPRATAVNSAMLNILRFDLAALGEEFELRGLRAGNNWTLELVPRSPAIARAVRKIVVEGISEEVRRITLQRTAKQSVQIDIAPREEMTPFTSEEIGRYFRARE